MNRSTWNLGSVHAASTLGRSGLSVLRFFQHEFQRVHVLLYHFLWPRSACYMGTLGPRCLVDGYLNLLGMDVHIVSCPFLEDKYRRGVTKGGNLTQALYVVYNLRASPYRPYMAAIRAPLSLNSPPEAALSFEVLSK